MRTSEINIWLILAKKNHCSSTVWDFWWKKYKVILENIDIDKVILENIDKG